MWVLRRPKPGGWAWVGGCDGCDSSMSSSPVLCRRGRLGRDCFMSPTRSRASSACGSSERVAASVWRRLSVSSSERSIASSSLAVSARDSSSEEVEDEVPDSSLALAEPSCIWAMPWCIRWVVMPRLTPSRCSPLIDFLRCWRCSNLRMPSNFCKRKAWPPIEAVDFRLGEISNSFAAAAVRASELRSPSLKPLSCWISCHHCSCFNTRSSSAETVGYSSGDFPLTISSYDFRLPHASHSTMTSARIRRSASRPWTLPLSSSTSDSYSTKTAIRNL